MSYRKVFLKCEEVQGSNLLTNFHGMDFTRDRLCALIRKWHTLIEAYADVKTTDGYTLRLFCIGFTRRNANQLRKTSYAQSSQIRGIRRRMTDIMSREGSKSDLKELVNQFVSNSIATKIEKSASAIYPLQNVYIRKVKTLKTPKFDLTKLLEMHEGGAEGSEVVEEAPLVESIPGAGGKL